MNSWWACQAWLTLVMLCRISVNTWHQSGWAVIAYLMINNWFDWAQIWWMNLLFNLPLFNLIEQFLCICRQATEWNKTNHFSGWAKIGWANLLWNSPCLINFWLHSAEFHGLWFVKNSVPICRQIYYHIGLTFSGWTHHRTPQAWLTSGHFPPKSHHFLGCDLRNSFHAFADKLLIWLTSNLWLNSLWDSPNGPWEGWLTWDNTAESVTLFYTSLIIPLWVRCFHWCFAVGDTHVLDICCFWKLDIFAKFPKQKLSEKWNI